MNYFSAGTLSKDIFTENFVGKPQLVSSAQENSMHCYKGCITTINNTVFPVISQYKYPSIILRNFL